MFKQILLPATGDAADLDAAVAAAHPVSSALGALAATAGTPSDGEPIQPDDTDLATALGVRLAQVALKLARS